MSTLWPRMRGLVLFGWLVALIRFGLEPTVHPEKWDPAWFVGAYFLMPLAFLFVGIRGTLDDLRWPKVALMSLLLGLLVWGIPNAITYTTAQFLGWTHGRFRPEGPLAPVATEPLVKIGRGLLIGGLTTIAGAIWCLLTTTLFIWLPGVIRRRRRHAV